VAKTSIEGEREVLEKYESVSIRLAQKVQAFLLCSSIKEIVVRSEKYVIRRDIAVILTQLYKTRDSGFQSSKCSFWG
jgi:hypothetical protein